jgi:hypothetical protein
VTVKNTFPSGAWAPAGVQLANAYGHYYLAEERRLAREHARRVHEYEAAGKTGAWKLWQDFIDQWDLRSLEREHLNQCFDMALSDCQGQREHDPEIPDGS